MTVSLQRAVTVTCVDRFSKPAGKMLLRFSMALPFKKVIFPLSHEVLLIYTNLGKRLTPLTFSRAYRKM